MKCFSKVKYTINLIDSLPLLVNLLNEGTLDRQLVVSTIRACGELGENTLLKVNKTKVKLSFHSFKNIRY